jgi:large subunit ribosomal protein L25
LEILELTSTARTAVGKGVARKLRREGKIPAVLYGPGSQPVPLTISISSLDRVLKRKSAGRSIFNLSIQDGGTTSRTVMIKDIQRDPVSRNFLHIDFYEIDMNRKIRVSVPVITKGKAKGVENGGILQIIRREIEILCLPMEIPDSIEIDVAPLDIGDAIHVTEIVPQGHIEIPAETNYTVVTVVTPKLAEPEPGEKAEEEAVEEGAAEEETGEPATEKA